MSLLTSAYTPNPGDAVVYNGAPLTVNSTVTMASTPKAICATGSGALELFTLGSLDFTEVGAAAPGVIKPTTGTLFRAIVVSPGSAGNLTFNDCATVGAAASGNQISTTAYSSLSAGEVILPDHLCTTGIVISSVPTGGQVLIDFA